MAVQLASDEVYVATGEPWRRWFDDWSWKRIRELAHACGWEGAAMETGNHVNEEEAARPRRRVSRAVAVVVAAGPPCVAGEDVAARWFPG
jgi:hypothetical protein